MTELFGKVFSTFETSSTPTKLGKPGIVVLMVKHSDPIPFEEVYIPPRYKRVQLEDMEEKIHAARLQQGGELRIKLLGFQSPRLFP